MRISRAGDFGGYLSLVNSLSMSVWDDLSFVAWWSIHQKMKHCGHKGMDMVSSNNAQVDCGVENDVQLVLKGQENSQHTITSPAAWAVDSRQDGSMLSCCWPSIWMSQQKSRLIKPGTFFQTSIVLFWWALANCNLSFLFSSDRTVTGLCSGAVALLLWHVVNSEMLSRL